MKIGPKLKQLRRKNNFTQEELANRCGLTKGFISQIENDLTSPSLARLTDLLKSLGTNLQDFFNEKEEEKIVFTTEDIFVKNYEDGKYIINWIVPNAQRNNMEPILIELEGRAKTFIDAPHDGEEFGYVLMGSVYVYLGSKHYRVRKGESFYYRASNDHYLMNAGKGKARVLWISTPPNF